MCPLAYARGYNTSRPPTLLRRHEFERALWKRFEIHCDQERPDPDHGRAEIEPTVAPKAVDDHTSDHRAGRHPEAAGHGGSADDGAHHAQREILAGDHGIERHDARIDEPEHSSRGIELAQLPHYRENCRTDGLKQQSEYEHAL